MTFPKTLTVLDRRWRRLFASSDRATYMLWGGTTFVLREGLGENPTVLTVSETSTGEVIVSVMVAASRSYDGFCRAEARAPSLRKAVALVNDAGWAFIGRFGGPE